MLAGDEWNEAGPPAQPGDCRQSRLDFQQDRGLSGDEVPGLRRDRPFQGGDPRFDSLDEQEPFRREVLLGFLAERGVELERCAAVAGRGGLTKPLPGGVYRVNARMLRNLKSGRWGVHPCNLGAPLAADLGRAGGAPAFVVDPPVVDELSPLARYSGHPAI